MSPNAAAKPHSLLSDPLSVAMLTVTILAWSSSFPAIRAGLQAFGPIALGSARFTIAAIPAALFLLITRPALPNLKDAARFFAGGALFVAAYTSLLNIGEGTVSAGAASFIISTAPIIISGLSAAFLGERFSRLAWVGAAVSLAGVGLLGLGEAGGLSFGLGALYVFGAAVCAAVATILQKPLFSRHKPLTVSAWNMVIGAALLSPALPVALTQFGAAPLAAQAAAVYLGIAPSLIAYATWTVALSRLPAGRASNFLYCQPPLATLIGFVWLHEAPSPLSLFGGALALGGVILVNFKPKPKRLGA